MADRKPGTDGTRFTPQRKEIYLSELRRTGLKPMARLACNMSPSGIIKHRKRNPEFAEAEFNALVEYKQKIEDEINRRAIEGVVKPVYQRGERVGSVQEYSDRLLIELARRHIEDYRPNVKIDQTTKHSGGVAVGLEDLSKLPREGRDLLRKLLQCEIPEDDDVPEEEA